MKLFIFFKFICWIDCARCLLTAQCLLTTVDKLDISRLCECLPETTTAEGYYLEDYFQITASPEVLDAPYFKDRQPFFRYSTIFYQNFNFFGLYNLKSFLHLVIKPSLTLIEPKKKAKCYFSKNPRMLYEYVIFNRLHDQ